MTGGSERRSNRSMERAVAVLAVVVLVAAGFGPAVGLALGGDGPSDGSVVPAGLSPIPNPTTDGDDGSEWTTVDVTIAPPNETSVRRTSDSPTRTTSPDATRSTSVERTTELRTSTTTGVAGPPTSTDISEPPTDLPGPTTTTDVSILPTRTEIPDSTTAEIPDFTTTETPPSTTPDGTRTTTGRAPQQTTEDGDAGRPPGGPSPPGGPPDDAPGNGRPGAGPPGSGPPGTGPPSAGPPGEGPPGAGPPDDPRGGPGDGEVRPPGHEFPRRGGDGPRPGRGDPGGNRTGPPANRTHPPGDWAGRPGNRTGRPGNWTERPGNWTDKPNASATKPNATRPPRSDVNVTVENATANAPVSVNVSAPADRDRDVSFSSVNVTPTRNGSFSLNVTASDDPIPGRTPSIDLSNGTRSLGYLSVDHSIADANVSDVTFTFRVRTGRVNASERDAVTLYRFHGGTWNELPTTLVRTTDAYYVYRVRSPGLSEFAAGKKRPEFEITDAAVTDDALSVGDPLRVRVRVENRGSADGTFTATLRLDGESVARRKVTIAAGGMRQATFETETTESGSYEVSVNDYRIGEVTVVGATDDGTTTASADATPSDGGTDYGSTDRTDHGSTDRIGHEPTDSGPSDRTGNTATVGTTSAFGAWAVAFLTLVVAGRRWW